MDVTDAIIFTLLAVADLALIAHLRGKRRSREQGRRMQRSLVLAVRRETPAEARLPETQHLRHAS